MQDRDNRRAMAPMLLTPSDVAKALRWGRSKTYRLLARGDIPSVRVDGSRRVRTSDLEAYVAHLGDGWKVTDWQP